MFFLSDETRPRGVIEINFINQHTEIIIALVFFVYERLSNGRSTADFVYKEGAFFYNKVCMFL